MSKKKTDEIDDDYLVGVDDKMDNAIELDGETVGLFSKDRSIEQMSRKVANRVVYIWRHVKRIKKREILHKTKP